MKIVSHRTNFNQTSKESVRHVAQPAAQGVPAGHVGHLLRMFEKRVCVWQTTPLCHHEKIAPRVELRSFNQP